MLNLKESDVLKQFQNLIPELQSWGEYVDSVLTVYLNSLGYSHERIPYMPCCRVKDEASYIEKALYRNKGYTIPLKEITDKVGTRVVLLNIDDVERVSEFIRDTNAWHLVEQAQDINYIRKHDPKEFKYQSNHFVVKPKEEQKPENIRDYLTCEIQVRTLLQHAYAETSHDTMYKKGHSGDPQMERSLAVTMAFLETADDKIKSIYDKAEEKKTQKITRLESLADMFRFFEPSFNNTYIDVGLSDSLFVLFDNDFLNKAISEIPTFIKEHEDDIKAAIGMNSRPILFSQPICLLVFYAIIKKQTCLIRNWPYSYDVLTMVLRVMGISNDVLV